MSTLTADEITRRVKVLTTIAMRYHEFVDPMQSRAGTGDGTPMPLMPATYTATVREFERLMTRMREDRREPLIVVAGDAFSVRALRWHVQAFHIDAKRVTRHYPAKRVKGRKLQVATGQEILRDSSGAWIPSTTSQTWVRTKGARGDLARAGIEWAAAHWPDGIGEPMLPADVRAAA